MRIALTPRSTGLGASTMNVYRRLDLVAKDASPDDHFRVSTEKRTPNKQHRTPGYLSLGEVAEKLGRSKALVSRWLKNMGAKLGDKGALLIDDPTMERLKRLDRETPRRQAKIRHIDEAAKALKVSESVLSSWMRDMRVLRAPDGAPLIDRETMKALKRKKAEALSLESR